MDTLLLKVILALGLHYSTVRSLDSRLETDNADVQKLICDKHNALRRSVNPTASDMQKMIQKNGIRFETDVDITPHIARMKGYVLKPDPSTYVLERTGTVPCSSQYLGPGAHIRVWSKEAAATAKKVAAKCIYEHSSEQERTISTSTCGENLAKASGMFLSWDACIQLWFDEYKDFEYGTGAKETGAEVLHYTQVVWSKSALLGCACQQCSGFDLYVCHYAPQGNIGQVITKPYEQGIPCGKCPNNCENKLCTNPCLYLDRNDLCPSYKPYCSQSSVSSGCQATCKCG